MIYVQIILDSSSEDQPNRADRVCTAKRKSHISGMAIAEFPGQTKCGARALLRLSANREDGARLAINRSKIDVDGKGRCGD